MNKPKMKGFIFLAIFLILFGTIFRVAGSHIPTAEDVLDNGGEKANAIVLESDSEDTYTIVQIDDEDSFYDGEIVETRQYVSTLKEGAMTTVYYDGETLVLSAMSGFSTIFVVIGKVIQGLGVLVLVFGVARLLIFIAKVGVAGLAIGSIANEVQQQEQFNNQFYGNSEGRTYTQYPQDQQYQNQQYQQPYNNQYQQNGYNQGQYNQNQQPYNNQYQNQQSYNNQYQNNQNDYYNQ